VAEGTNPATTHSYDGDGNRTGKTVGVAAGSYVNDARGLPQVLQENRAASRVSCVPGVRQYDPSQATDPQRWGYPLSDGQSNRLLADGNVAVAHRGEWEPFGRVRADGGSTSSLFGCGGEEKDDETGLVNLRSRYYDPAIGRFPSRDNLTGTPTMAQTWNRYSYVENDPINALAVPQSRPDDPNVEGAERGDGRLSLTLAPLLQKTIQIVAFEAEASAIAQLCRRDCALPRPSSDRLLMHAEVLGCF
jgi:RHS repeat-associated protein